MEINLPTGSHTYMWIYLGLTAAIIILSFFGNYFFTKFCITAAQKLHNSMLNALLKTKMGFFDTTPQGRILNRLSKDTDAIDSSVMKFA